MTVIRREAGAALLNNFFDNGIFTGVQAVVMLLMMTFLSPCINAIIILMKERGIKTGIFMMLFSITYSITVATIVNYVLTSLKINF